MITCVARAARSLEESCSLLDFAVWALPGAALLVFGFAVVLDMVRELVCDVIVELSPSSNSNSLSVTTVAVVHVDIDVRAVLTASVFACSEAILVRILCI